MPLLSEHQNPRELTDRLRDAHAVTGNLMSQIIGEMGRRFSFVGQSKKTARIEQLICRAPGQMQRLRWSIWSCRNGKFVASLMTVASGIAHCRVSASFQNGSINQSKLVTRIWRWPF